MSFLTVIKSLASIYLILCVAVYFFQRSMIYHPAEATKHNNNTVKITDENHTIEALETNQGAPDVIIYFGGNAENVAYSATDFDQKFPNHSTYLMKYRGYAGATGKPTEENLFADALTLYDHINLTPNIKVTVIGRSLGSGVATYLATERTVDKLILITPFDSIRSIGQAMLPIFPVSWLLHDHFDSKAKAPRIQSPTLVIVATNDQVIARHHTESLMQSIPKHHLNTTVINAGHNDLDLMPEYYSTINLFLNSTDQP